MQIIPEKLPPTHFSTIYVGNDKLEIDLLLAMLISSVHDGWEKTGQKAFSENQDVSQHTKHIMQQ